MKTLEVQSTFIFSTQPFSWHWSIDYFPPEPGGIGLEKTGFAFTRRGARRAIRRAIKRDQRVQETFARNPV